ncbi:TolB family protein [Cloacibacillus porcorum]|uniref:TolB family protein n=1 Tax=Cloacibacillus porcorum TaxID=1197717 RepID=UPI003F048153
MKKFTILLPALVLILFTANPSAAEKITFSRVSGGDFYIYTADSATGKTTRLCKGYDPEISPDGGTVAYTQYDKTGGRFIAFCDIASRKSRVIKEVPGKNSYGPRWSSNGRRLLYNIFIDQSRWLPALYDLDTRKNMTIGRDTAKTDLFGPFWSSDSAFVYAFDFENIYKFSETDGRLMENIPINRLLPSDNILISSATGISVSPDDTMWLFAAEVGGEKCALCAAAGSPAETKGAVFIYRLTTKKTERLAVGGLCVSDAAWLGADEIIFSAHAPSEKSRAKSANIYDIYRMKLNGEKPRKIIADGRAVSAAK